MKRWVIVYQIYGSEQLLRTAPLSSEDCNARLAMFESNRSLTVLGFEVMVGS